MGRKRATQAAKTPGSAGRPSKLTIRSYQVGFGDCFLLTFHYPDRPRSVLIDFGSTRLPPGADKDHLTRVAEDIRSRCQARSR